jgi:hypothetical protein
MKAERIHLNPLTIKKHEVDLRLPIPEESKSK